MHLGRGELSSIALGPDGKPARDRIRFILEDNPPLREAFKRLEACGISFVFKEKEQQIVYYQRRDKNFEEIGFQPFGNSGSKIQYTGSSFASSGEPTELLHRALNSFVEGWQKINQETNKDFNK